MLVVLTKNRPKAKRTVLMKGSPHRIISQEYVSVLIPKLRNVTHENRLRIAHQISARIVEKYGSDVLAVYVCGSTSKKLDRAYSDLELIVAVRDQVEIPMKYYLHRGLIIQIEYFKASNILDAAERLTDNWPWEADQYRNRIALYERDGWFRKLDEAVAKNDKAGSVEAIRKSFIMMTESMAVMRKAIVIDDKVGGLLRGGVLAEGAARVVLLLNPRYVTTTSWVW